MYQRKLQQALALATALALSACGGGSGDSTSAASSSGGDVNNRTISGMVATGAAVSGAKVKALCKGGQSSQAQTTSQDGTFTLQLDSNQSYPCLVNATFSPTASSGVGLVSIAQGGGHVNVTPVTDLIAWLSSGGNVFSLQFSNIADNTKIVIDQIHRLTGSKYNGDPLRGSLVVGDSNDMVLDAIQRTLKATGNENNWPFLATSDSVSTLAELAKRSDGRGVLNSVTKKAAWSSSEISLLADALRVKGIQGLAAIKCGVAAYQIDYQTVGPKGEKTNATGVMLIPTGSGCEGPSPLLAYARSEDLHKQMALADMTTISETKLPVPQNNITSVLGLLYASQGITVVATDYLGYAGSQFPYHPFLHADSEASTVIDSLRAARLAAYQTGANLSSQILLAGYSQGGHASMAAQRAIERDNASEFKIVAASHMAGLYNLIGALPSAIQTYPSTVAFAALAWSNVYGSYNLSDIFINTYAPVVNSLMPYMPSNEGNYLYFSYQRAADIFVPDVYSALKTNGSAFNATAAAIQTAASLNSLINGWTPQSSMQLCGGAYDPAVPPSLHQNLFPTTSGKVSIIDVDDEVEALYVTLDMKTKQSYQYEYHDIYEAVVCHMKAQTYFKSKLGGTS